MICIHHDADLDGYSSGAIVKYKHPDAKLIGYDYGRPIPSIPDGEDVVLVDISLPMDEMFKLAKRSKSFVWIDHHISAIKDYEAMSKIDSAPITCVLQVGKAACELAWEYFFPGEGIPLAIKLLGSYDVWRNQDVTYWEEKILPFQLAMRISCNSAETFPQVLFDIDMLGNSSKECKGLEAVLIEHGQVILAYQKANDIRACRAAFVAEFQGYRALCLNASGNSTIFDSIWDSEKHDLMMVFHYNGNKEWKATLYGKKENVDCSVLAKNLGGGGHKMAAGFKTNDIFAHLKDIKPHFERA